MENTDVFIPGPSNPTGSIAGTAAGLALTPVLGPFAPLAGSLLGGFLGGAGGGNGLGAAFGAGVGSLFSNKQTTSQTQAVDQTTNVNVSNVLGGRNFGNYDTTTGQFDTYQAIADVYAIREAQQKALQSVTQTTAAPVVQAAQKEKINWLPLILVGGLAVVLYATKGKK